MSKIIDVLLTKKNLLIGDGEDLKKIEEAEKKLNVDFADDYSEYLKQCSIAAYEGHELTGLIDYKLTNVVDVTIEEKKYNPNIPDGMYVIERTGIDGVIIWQDSKRTIYYSQLDKPPVRYCDSLIQYIELY